MGKHIITGLLCSLVFTVPARSQIISTVGGDSTWGSVSFLALDAAGNLYASDQTRNVVYKVDRLGNATIVAGKAGSGGYAGDGAGATSALLNNPDGIAVAADGTLYIADFANDRIRKVAPDGIITTIAGVPGGGFSGDGGPAVNARLNGPGYLFLDSKGVLFLQDDLNFRIRKIGTDGLIKTVAGSGRTGVSADGGPATSANMRPGALTVSADGSIYFADAGDVLGGEFTNPRVRKVAIDGSISTVAGTGTRGFSGDGGQAAAAELYTISGLVFDSGGNLYISNEFNSQASSIGIGERIRKVAPNGIITTYAGTGEAGYTGDGGPATSARINTPGGMVVDAQNNLYFADAGNDRIRKIVPATPPTISFTDATIPVFLGKTSFGSNMYVTLYGSNLATTTQAWDNAFTGANAPTSLGGVSVTVNNKPAFMEYVSPSQININTPEDTATGPVNIQVRNDIGLSNIGTATRARLSPALLSAPNFSAGGKNYVVAQTPNFSSFIGPLNLIQGVTFTAAKPGDTVIIFAVGCGPTTPATQAGVIAAQNSPLALQYQVKIGGIAATVPFAGMLAGTVGLYQLNVVIPTLTSGDQSIELIVDGVPNAQSLSITVGQ
jgi:uncharacterized protein (TIGR03437 family)